MVVCVEYVSLFEFEVMIAVDEFVVNVLVLVFAVVVEFAVNAEESVLCAMSNVLKLDFQ